MLSLLDQDGIIVSKTNEQGSPEHVGRHHLLAKRRSAFSPTNAQSYSWCPKNEDEKDVGMTDSNQHSGQTLRERRDQPCRTS